MKKLLTLSLSIWISSIAIAQNKEKRYITSEDIVYTHAQYDSLVRVPLSLALVRDTIVNGEVFTLLRVYKSIPKPFTDKYKGKRVPEIKLTTIKGEVISISDLRGKVIMLNFWSTSCGPCIMEIPQLNQLYETYKDRVVFVATLPEGKGVAKKFLKKHPFEFTIAPDAGKVFEDLGVDGYPKNLFIDKNGIIKDVREGTPIEVKPKTGYEISVLKTYSKLLDEILAEN